MFEQIVEKDAGPDWGDGEIDDIAECERNIRSTQARQAHHIADLYEKRLELVKKAHRLEDGKIAQSVIGEVAMARQVSASTAANQFGFALGLKRLPSTDALFSEGAISERVARAVTTETGGLAAADARTIDDQLAEKLPTLTAMRAAAAARKLAIGLDPHGAQHATNVARSERHISIHALPHSMAAIRMNLPAEQAVAVYRALDDYAQGRKYEGDPRTGSQIPPSTSCRAVPPVRHLSLIHISEPTRRTPISYA